MERHAAYAASGEEADYFINRAFEKMWLALSPERFGGFPDLKSLLRYLQMCVHSAVYDVVRKTGREVAEIDIDAQMETSPFPQDDDVIDVEREALEQSALTIAHLESLVGLLNVILLVAGNVSHGVTKSSFSLRTGWGIGGLLVVARSGSLGHGIPSLQDETAHEKRDRHDDGYRNQRSDLFRQVGDIDEQVKKT